MRNELVEREQISTSAANQVCWIFQASPKNYDIDAALQELTQLNWSVTKYADRIAAGHKVFIWKAGQNGGLVGEATVLDAPGPKPEDIRERPFYMNPDAVGDSECGVTLRIDAAFGKPALSRTQAKANDVLQHMLVIRSPAGTNFPLKHEEVLAIRQFIDSAAPPGENTSINQDERAFKVWNALCAAAAQKQTLTYGRLGEVVGVHHRAVRFILAPIQDYCLQEKLPPLTILAVSQQTSQPSEGFIAWDTANIEEGLASVFGYAWHALENPFSFAADGTSEDDIVSLLERKPGAAADVYSRVKVRGIAQTIFRKLMLRVYRSSCAFCGLTFTEALEAAHIVPWHKATPAQRMDPSNGLLLCSTHHRLFDSGCLGLSIDYSITHDLRISAKYSDSDKAMISELAGRRITIPVLERHQPSSSFIRLRNE